MKYSNAQIKILKSVYDSEEGILLKGNYKRTIEILARGRLVTYKYISGGTSKVSDKLKVSKSESPRLMRKAEKLIETYLEET